ncbi:MAG: discoidin domain-containing protein [Magnetococcus sp. XQGC-1]
MAPHRSWRIQITDSTSGSDLLISLYEVELRATPGGPDQCTGGLASASHADATAYRLFDDNPSSYWINGGPGLPSWLQYDFGAGNAVEVGEVRLLPRSAVQAPQSFALHYSDDNVTWEVAASWSGVTDWISGVEKLFIPPPPPALHCLAHSLQPFSITLAAGRSQGYTLGAWCHGQHTARYALHLERGGAQEWRMGEIVRRLREAYSVWVERGGRHSYSVQLGMEKIHHWQDLLARACRQSFRTICQRAGHHPWSLRHPLRVGHAQSCGSTSPVSGRVRNLFILHQRNPVATTHLRTWNLRDPGRVVQSRLPTVTLAAPGPGMAGTLSLSASKIYHDPEQPFWRAELHLVSAAAFASMQLDDLFSVQINGESFTLLVDGKRLQREGNQEVKRILYGISPTARHAAPRAAPIRQQWPESRRAMAVVEELLGEAVEWLLPDWWIPAGRLLVQALTPMQVVQQIVESAGGWVQSRANGQLWAGPRFPHTVPEWSLQQAEHLLTDGQDILAIAEEQTARARVDRVVVRSQPLTGQEWPFFIHPEGQAAGSNRKSSHLFPGEMAHFVLVPQEAGTQVEVATSIGEAADSWPTQWQQTEEVAFVGSNRGRLALPASGIGETLWLGSSLGEPLLQADGRTLITPQTGTAVLRITYEVAAMAYAVSIPQQLADEEPFPLLATATGQYAGTGTLEVAMQRGDARHPLHEVVAPLLSDRNLLACRARAELDLGEALQTVTVTIPQRPGLAPGQLVEVQDGEYGRTFRGLLVGVSHEIDSKKWISRLVLWR